MDRANFEGVVEEGEVQKFDVASGIVPNWVTIGLVSIIG
jgi:hypothetical protein